MSGFGVLPQLAICLLLQQEAVSLHTANRTSGPNNIAAQVLTATFRKGAESTHVDDGLDYIFDDIFWPRIDQNIDDVLADYTLADSGTRQSKQGGGKKNSTSTKLLYDHMPKAGGTFLIPLLRQAVGGANFDFRSEFSPLHRGDVRKDFVIGSVRNPCDYYVSLWAYGSDHGGAMMAKVPMEHRYLYENTSSTRNSSTDIHRFHKWVRMLNQPGHPGVMSVRFARSYAKMERDIRASAPPAALSHQDLMSVKRSLRTPKFLDRVDCWVKLESLNQDAQHCLRDWQRQTGNDVNWTAYEQTFATSKQLQSSHAPCRTYFTPELEKTIRLLEAPIFKNFKYDTCCS